MDPLKHLIPKLLKVNNGTFVDISFIDDILVEIFHCPERVGQEWIEVAKMLLKDERVDLHKMIGLNKLCDIAMVSASVWGYFDIVKLLLQDKRIDPSGDNNYAIRFASKYGYFGIVGLLLNDERVNPSDDNNYAIRFASDNGHFDLVRLLLDNERINLSKYDFLSSSHDGKMNLVKILFEDEELLSKFDPKNLIITLLNNNDKDIAAFAIAQIDTTKLTRK